MKRFIVLFAVFALFTTLSADNYQILMMNTPSIKIGDKICKVKDVFSDTDVIHWSAEQQAIKAKNTTTKKIRLFTNAEFKKKECLTVAAYIKNTALSTRGFDLSDLKEYLGQTFYLLDSIRIESPIPIDEQIKYWVDYSISDEHIRRELDTVGDDFVIDRAIFEPYNIDKVTVSITLTNEGIKDGYILTDKMVIIVLPLGIKTDEDCSNPINEID